MSLYEKFPKDTALFKRAPNLLDADATITPGTDRYSLYVMPAGTMTANRAITTSNAGAIGGQVYDIIKEGPEAFTLSIKNAVGTDLLVIAAGTSVRAEIFFNGAWVLSVWCYV